MQDGPGGHTEMQAVRSHSRPARHSGATEVLQGPESLLFGSQIDVVELQLA